MSFVWYIARGHRSTSEISKFSLMELSHRSYRDQQQPDKRKLSEKQGVEHCAWRYEVQLYVGK